VEARQPVKTVVGPLEKVAALIVFPCPARETVLVQAGLSSLIEVSYFDTVAELIKRLSPAMNAVRVEARRIIWSVELSPDALPQFVVLRDYYSNLRRSVKGRFSISSQADTAEVKPARIKLPPTAIHSFIV